MAQTPATWPEKLSALREIPNVTYVNQLDPFSAPKPGNFMELGDAKYLITKSETIDGVVFGVAKGRSQCLMAVELPGGSAIAVVARSPTVLETLVPQVFRILGDSFALGAI